jgi:hypothetical protein
MAPAHLAGGIVEARITRVSTLVAAGFAGCVPSRKNGRRQALPLGSLERR